MRITMLNFIKIGQPVAELMPSIVFKMPAICHVRFFKIHISKQPIGSVRPIYFILCKI